MTTFSAPTWRPAVVLLLLALGTAGCHHQGNVDQEYVFAPVASTKAIRAHVSVLLSQSDSSDVNSAAKEQQFLLSAYAMDANGLAVSLAGPAGQALMQLPVTLAGATTALDVDVLVPTTLEPGSSGYNFHFQLVRASSASSQALLPPGHLARYGKGAVVTTHAQLDTVCGNVQPGSPAADNPVNLSISTSVAYQLVQSTAAGCSPAAFVSAHAALAELLTANQSSVEAELLANASLSVDDYAAAVALGLQDLLVQQATLQAQAVDILGAAASAGQSQSASAQSAFAAAFSSAMANIAEQVTQTLGDTSNRVTQTFAPSYVNGHASAGVNAAAPTSVYAAAWVQFTDSDVTSSIGGTVVITPPAQGSGITSYRVYLGPSAANLAQFTLLGSAPAGGPTASFVVPQGTAVPPQASRIWVQTMAGQTGLALASTSLNNRTSFVSGLVATGATLSAEVEWQPVAGAVGYKLYRSPASPVAQSSPIATLTATFYVDTGLIAGTTYVYALSSIDGSGHESALSQEASALVLAAPPAPTLGLQPGADRITLTWPGVPLATDYNLYVSAGQPNAPSSLLAQVSATGDSAVYIDFAAQYGTNYYYQVAAIAGSIEGSRSSNTEGTLTLEPPQLSCQSIFGNPNYFATCNVQAAANAVSYNIYRGTTLPVMAAGLVRNEIYPAFDVPEPTGALRYYTVQSVDSAGRVSSMSQTEGVVLGGLYPATDCPAILVLGQATLSATAAGCSPTTFAGMPIGLAISREDMLFVSDPVANRVVGFGPVNKAVSGMQASVLLGQPDFGSTGPGPVANGFSSPLGLAFDTITQMPTLMVSDANNGRVLLFDGSSPITSNQAPIVALGVSDPNHVGSATLPAATALRRPVAASIQTGTAAVADSLGNRVLLYQNVFAPGLTEPNTVLGQPDLNSTAANAGGLSASSLSYPTSVWTDGSRVVVYDAGNARVLLWNSFPTSNGEPADFVIGQPDMNTSLPGAATATSLAGATSGNYPPGLASNGTQLAVADTANHRVLLFDQFPAINQASADRVLGQASMSTSTPGVASGTQLNLPTSVAFWNTNHVLVSDSGNKRVLLF